MTSNYDLVTMPPDRGVVLSLCRTSSRTNDYRLATPRSELEEIDRTWPL